MAKAALIPATREIRNLLARDLTLSAVERINGLFKAVGATPRSNTSADQQLVYAQDFLFLAEKALKNFMIETGLTPTKGDNDG